MAYIESPLGSCGGALVAPGYVLTAAQVRRRGLMPAGPCAACLPSCKPGCRSPHPTLPQPDPLNPISPHHLPPPNYHLCSA